MLKLLIACSVFSLVFLSVLCNKLRCYDCATPEGEACSDPRGNNVRSKVCVPTNSTTARSFIKKSIEEIERKDIGPRALGSNRTFECFSMSYRNSNDSSQNGIYRDCLEVDTSIGDSCDFLREMLDGEITECISCNDLNCNTHQLRGGTTGISVSLALLFVNAVICVFLAKTD